MGRQPGARGRAGDGTGAERSVPKGGDVESWKTASGRALKLLLEG